MPITRRTILKGASSLPTLFFTREKLSAAPMKESRTIFCEGLTWIGGGAASAEFMCDRIKNAGFNVILAYIWHGYGVTWPSTIVSEWDTRLSPIPGEDSLEILIQAAHKRNMEVHACFTVMLRRNPFYSEFHTDAAPREMFDAHNPAFRDFVVALMTEVLKNYAIDGLCLDYIRTGVGSERNSSWAQAYRTETGRNLELDVARLTARIEAGEEPSKGHTLFRWQEAAVGEIVRRVSAARLLYRPMAILSVYGAPFDFPSLLQGRDSAKWANERTIDVIFWGAYAAAPNWTDMRRRQSRLKRPEACVAVCANYDIDPMSKAVTPRTGEKVSTLLTQSRVIGRWNGVANGIALYLYSQLTDDQINELANGALSTPSIPNWRRLS